MESIKHYKVFLSTEEGLEGVKEENFIFETLGQARKKIKELYNTQDHRFVILLNLWAVWDIEGDEEDEGLNSKYTINQLDCDRDSL